MDTLVTSLFASGADEDVQEPVDSIGGDRRVHRCRAAKGLFDVPTVNGGLVHLPSHPRVSTCHKNGLVRKSERRAPICTQDRLQEEDALEFIEDCCPPARERALAVEQFRVAVITSSNGIR